MQKRKLGLALALAAAVITFFIGQYFSEQFDIHDTMLKRLDYYWKVGNGETLRREAAYAHEQRRDKGFTHQYSTTSNIATSIYLQVYERNDGKQKIRIYVLSRNASWTSKVSINGPYAYVFESWKESPTKDQIERSIYSSRVQHFGGDHVLGPQQSYLVHTEFTFPYPMLLNFTVSSSLTENRLNERQEKSVADSVHLRGDDLNAIKVTP